jgi:hypothetical protein
MVHVPFIFLELINLIKFGEKEKLRTSLLCSIIKIVVPLTQSLFVINVTKSNIRTVVTNWHDGAMSYSNHRSVFELLVLSEDLV